MVFYYSGTGNSKYAAERLLTVTGGELISIPDCVKNGEFEFSLVEGEKLGIVFPVYCYTVPMTVQQFAKELKVNSSHEFYSYAVATCGATTGSALKTFNKLFPVSAIFGLPTVDNYIPFLRSAPSAEEADEIIKTADGILDDIIHQISRRESGNLNRHEGKGSKLLSAISGRAYAKRRPTADFNINDDCIGCGLCEKICPTESIKIADGKAKFVLENCDLCFACIHRCPKEAINYKNSTQGKGRYVNTHTTL